MSTFRILSASEQVAEHLRQEMIQGIRRGEMCGSDQLAVELGIGRKTAELALRQLEREGQLVGQGLGCRRLIASLSAPGPRTVRLIFQHLQRGDQGDPLVIEVQNQLREAGHAVVFAQKSLLELDMNPRLIARQVAKTEADGWIVFAGSGEVLEWFAAQPIPSFALFGARFGIPIASSGPDKTAAIHTATEELFRQGHSRISFICRSLHRTTRPSRVLQTFLADLQRKGIRSGVFNCPDWEETPAGLFECLDNLFRLTPPTALIVDEIPFLFATQQFLARRGYAVPDDVSLVSTDNDPALAFCDMTIAHIDWNHRPVLRNLVRWAASVGRGEPEVRQTTTSAVFVPGATIGPARVRS